MTQLSGSSPLLDLNQTLSSKTTTVFSAQWKESENVYKASWPAYTRQPKVAYSNFLSMMDAGYKLASCYLPCMWYTYCGSLFVISNRRQLIVIHVAGLFQLVKLPCLNSLTSHLPETLDLVFKLKRKSFSIEVRFEAGHLESNMH